MEVKLYVGNLSYSTTEDELRTLFTQSGTVTDVAIIKDRDSGRSKGFAFVTMSSQAEAEQAIKALNGTSVGDRELKVNAARPREEGAGRGSFSPRSGGGFGGGRSQGGFGGQRNRNSGGGTRRY
jgi:RNA recognition motif-containing protein